jgi:hypothetical protein
VAGEELDRGSERGLKPLDSRPPAWRDHDRFLSQIGSPMPASLFSQPFDSQGQPSRFGDLLNQQLTSGLYTQGVICSAYASTTGTGVTAPALQSFTAGGRKMEVLVGLGNGVTSAQAVSHLLVSGASVHGFATGSFFIFHPKVYLLEGPARAWLAIGSCNLTGEGLYRNFEVMTVSDLNLGVAADASILRATRAWLASLNNHMGNLIALVSPSLPALVSSGLLIDEAATRTAQQAAILRAVAGRSRSGVPPIRVAAPPPPGPGFGRPRRVSMARPPRAAPGRALAPAQSHGPLVWEKRNIKSSDALRGTGSSSTNPVGGLRLTQADFKVGGAVIDQTTYFRQLFNAYPWQPPARPRTAAPQEEADIPFDVRILGTPLGTQSLRVTHKPSGAAGQGNYTTMLHWGPIAQGLRTTFDIRGRTIRLYAPPPGASAPFTLEVV